MNRSESGFTLIEIMIVMAIIATLVGLVAVGIPIVTERASRLECQNNLKEMGTVLIGLKVEKGWPADRGAGFYLRLFLREQEIRKNPKLFICPGDDAVKDAWSEASDDEYRDFIMESIEKYKKRPKKILDVPDDMVSYAGRLSAVPKESDSKIVLIVDRQGADGATMHHKDGINVLYDNGSVEFLDREVLGVDEEETIQIGVGSNVPKLEELGYQPGG